MTVLSPSPARFGTQVYVDRLDAIARATAAQEIEALLITPSPNYGYLLGYVAPALERLTCLILPAEGQPTLVLPRLEEPLARHELGELAERIEIAPWEETDDPYRLVRHRLGGDGRRVAIEDQMWARFVLRLRDALGAVEMVEAGPVLTSFRRHKSAEEIERLAAAAKAADAAMLSITRERFIGRTEAEVHQRLLRLLTEAGHDSADFAIVASGPNSASPHHSPGVRRIEAGDAIVLDIGGTAAGYRSDTTRTAFAGEPPGEFLDLYRTLERAQQAAYDSVRPGIAARDVDTAARSLIAEAGYGELFLHRTGHGIGIETHEEPYIVASNDQPLEPGDAFSVEPGIYVEGRWGARIEDIVVCTETGAQRLNRSGRDLYLVD